MAANKIAHPNAECVNLISEYIMRKRLAKLGIMSSSQDLTAEKADAFLAIEDELDRIEAQKAKKKQKGR